MTNPDPWRSSRFRTRTVGRIRTPGLPRGVGAIERRVRGGDLRGPKAGAVALVAFFGSSLLAVHLLDARRPPADVAAPARVVAAALPAATTASAEPAPQAASPAPAPVPPAPQPSAPAEEEGEEYDLSAPPDLGVHPVPPPASAWARQIEECIARKIRESGDRDLRRAREERRLRVLPVRTSCEQELARQRMARAAPIRNGRAPGPADRPAVPRSMESNP